MIPMRESDPGESMCSTPDIPTPTPPPPPPQIGKAPEMGVVRKQNPMGRLPGMGGTFGPALLTGSAGIAQSSLNVGTNQLLGGGSK